MATTLPSITVSDAQLTRIQNAFTDPTGALTPVQNYKKWLIAQLIAYVKQYETVSYDANSVTQRQQFQAQIDTDFSTVT